MLSDQEELLSVLQSEEVDIVISGISGFAGLNLNLVAAKSNVNCYLLQTKESIVIAGAHFIKLVAITTQRLFLLIVNITQFHNV